MMSHRTVIAVLLPLLIGGVSRADWPTLHRDNQRSGHTDEIVAGPYERKWFRDFHDEMIATRVEAIVAEGKCFVGTFAGKLHALKVEDGSTVWTFAAAGPIGHSPCYHAGRLYVGSEGGAFDRGYLYCVNAADGRELWRHEVGGGVWVAPACDGERVYFGDRAGVFHALAAADGKPLWTLRTGGMILTPASIAEDGRIVFGSEDMHVYCVDPGGNLLWKSKKLAGLSLRDHAPTIWRGLAIVRTNPADGFHEVMNRNGEAMEAIQRAIPMGQGEGDDGVLMDKWGDYVIKPTAKRRAAEQEGIAQYLRENPADQSFFALSLDDGKEPWVSTVLYTAGLHNPPTPPAFNPKTGELFTYARSTMTYFLRGVRRYNVWATLDRDTGRLRDYWPERDKETNWAAFPMIGDETQSLSLMGDQLIGTHQGHLGLIDLKTRRASMLWDARDSYGGIFGPIYSGGLDERQNNPQQQRARAEGHLVSMPNEWHGPDRSIVSISDRRIFWVVGSQVVCIGGKDTPATPTGGTKPPEPIKRRLPNRVGGGNVAAGEGAAGNGDPVKPLTAQQVAGLVEVPDGRDPANDALSPRIRAALERQVLELIDGGEWAPLVVQLGISGPERHYWRTSETMAVLARAMPHLPEETHEKTKKHLHRMFDEGMPFTRPVHAPDGKRREPYDLGPLGRKFADASPAHAVSVEDLYGVWAFAYYAQGWDRVLTKVDDLRKIYANAKPLAFNPDTDGEAAERLNERIAGTIGYIRIMQRAKDAAEVERASGTLAELAALRVRHEQADGRLVRPLKKLHAAKASRYCGLTPEINLLLGRLATEPFGRNVRDLTTELPVWYQTYGERMIGGENYISPPHLSRGLFATLAGTGANRRELARFIDQPWCRADLAFIEKCIAALDADP